MRILMIVPGGVDRSGTERVIPVLLWMIERLAQRHRVHVIALQQYTEPCTYSLLGATIYNLGQPPQRLPKPLRALWLWQQLLSRYKTIAPVDVMYSFMGALPGFLTACLGRLYRTPTVVGLAGGELVALPAIDYGAQLHWSSRWQIKLALRLATRVTVLSQYMVNLAQKQGYQPVKLLLGVEPARIVAQPVSNPHSPWRLLHVASLNRVKDQSTLLHAIRQVVDAGWPIRLDIIGGDTLNGEIQALSARLGLQAYVQFHGFLPQAQVQPFFEQAHLFLLSSRYDAAGVVVLEAAAAGVPTVGTAVGYVADWAPERAWAVPVGDAHAFAAGIMQLLAEPEQRQALGQRAQAWVQRYDIDWSVRQLEDLFAQLR